MDMYASTIPQFIKMLDNLDSWIDKAVEHAKKKNFDPSVYLEARLAPDQYTFLRQVQSACDAAKTAAARLAGKDPPKHPDTETTLDEIRARINTCRDYLKAVAPADLANSEQRLIALPFRPGKGMRGTDYTVDLALPNFYFHIVTAYSILRHNGIDLGKTDYIGSMKLEAV
jgi:uncharacterized protein